MATTPLLSPLLSPSKVRRQHHQEGPSKTRTGHEVTYISQRHSMVTHVHYIKSVPYTYLLGPQQDTHRARAANHDPQGLFYSYIRALLLL
jgi:hypothetical protein